MLFLLVTVIVTTTRLVRLWLAAPPFWLSRQANNPNYLQRLRTKRASIKQWMICALLAWGFVASVELFQASDRLLETKSLGAFSILLAIRNFAVDLELASFVILFLFLVQWHLFKRVERLSGSTRKSQPN